MPRKIEKEIEQTFSIDATKVGNDVQIKLGGKGSNFFFFSVICEAILTMNKRENERGSYKCKNGFWLAVMDAVNNEIKEAANGD